MRKGHVRVDWFVALIDDPSMLFLQHKRGKESHWIDNRSLAKRFRTLRQAARVAVKENAMVIQVEVIG